MKLQWQVTDNRSRMSRNLGCHLRVFENVEPKGEKRRAYRRRESHRYVREAQLLQFALCNSETLEGSRGILRLKPATVETFFFSHSGGQIVGAGAF